MCSKLSYCTHYCTHCTLCTVHLSYSTSTIGSLIQGCGSGLIKYGSGSSSGSRSRSKLKQNFRRQFPSQIFLKSKFELNKIKNTGVIHQNFVQKVVSAILYRLNSKSFFKKITKKCIFPLKFLHFLAPRSGSGFLIRIPIHKVTESGSKTLP
jgi:hypothetical protein